MLTAGIAKPDRRETTQTKEFVQEVSEATQPVTDIMCGDRIKHSVAESRLVMGSSSVEVSSNVGSSARVKKRLVTIKMAN